MEEDFEPQLSCRGCMFLFTRDSGYSNYTVTDTEMYCVRHNNRNFGSEGSTMPSEFNPPVLRDEPLLDHWNATAHARCTEHTVPDPSISLSPHMHHIDCEGDEIMTVEAATTHALTTADPMPLLIARYFEG